MVAHRPTAYKADGQALETAAHRYMDMCANLSHNGVLGTRCNPGMVRPHVPNPGTVQIISSREVWNCEPDFMATFAKLLRYTRIGGFDALPFY